MPDNGEHSVAGGGGDPGVNAVSDDVVEGGGGALQIVDGDASELDVFGADGGGYFVGAADVIGAVIDAGEMTAGGGDTHGEEVKTGAAAKFQDPAIFDIGRRKAGDQGDGGDDSGVGILESKIAVGDLAGFKHSAQVYCNWR